MVIPKNAFFWINRKKSITHHYRWFILSCLRTHIHYFWFLINSLNFSEVPPPSLTNLPLFKSLLIKKWTYNCLSSYFFLNKIKYVFHKETHSIIKYKNDNPSLYFTTYKTPKLNPTKTKRKYKLLKIFFLFTLITTS